MSSTKTIKFESDGVEIEYVVDSENFSALMQVTDPLTDTAKLDELSNVGWLKKDVAEHKNTSNETLIKLARDKDKRVRIAALRNLRARGEIEIILELKSVKNLD